jgi:hypothetical protein
MADESTHLSGVRANIKAARRAILLPNPHKSASIEIVQLPPTIDEYELRRCNIGCDEKKCGWDSQMSNRHRPEK